MRIKRARKMLDLAENKYTDEQVEEIIRQTQVLARISIVSHREGGLSKLDETLYNEIADKNHEDTLRKAK